MAGWGTEHTGDVPVPLLAGIPYHTFPDFQVGPLTIRTFGLLVGIGVVLGAWLAARHAETFGVPRESTYSLAAWMVGGGIVGSRVTWVLSHLDDIDSPIDLIAVWEGGIQFSGGFIAAVLIGLPTFRRWSPKLRWRSLDGYAFGLAIGLAIGRLGCLSVGEHFGRTTDFALGTTYRGGDVQEDLLGDVPLTVGTTFHNLSLYELVHLLVLFGLMVAVRRWYRVRGTEMPPGTLMGMFVLWYGVFRFVTDSLRVNDERLGGLTGAQAMCLVLVPVGLWVLFRVRHLVAALPEDPEEIAAIQARALEKAGVAVGSDAVPAGDPAPGDPDLDDPDPDDPT